MFPLYVSSNESDNIFGIFRHIYVFVRFWGYIPFSVNLNSVPLPNKVKVSAINCGFLSIQISVYVIFFVLSITHHQTNFSHISYLIIHGLNTVNICAIFCGPIFVLVDVVNRQKIWRILKAFVYFDREILFIIPASASSIDYKKAKKSTKLYVITWTSLAVLVGIYSLLIYQKLHRPTVVVFAVSLILMVASVYVSILSIYTFLLHNAKIRFKVLNESLRCSFESNRKITEIKVSKCDICDTIATMAKLHGRLNDIIADTNACYSIQVMLCFAGVFSYFVFGIYGLYRIWFSSENIFINRQFLMTSISVFWSIFFLWLGLCVIYMGSSTVSEARYTGVVIHDYINTTRDSLIVERLLAFSQQLLHRVPDANCKMFSFDWTLIFSMIAATVTYLMILIQFDASNNQTQALAASYCMTPLNRNNTTS